MGKHFNYEISNCVDLFLMTELNFRFLHNEKKVDKICLFEC